MDPFEQSLINFARLESLNDLRRSGDYDFSQHSIPITTRHNIGKIKNCGYNKCFFISLSQGFKPLYNINPIILMNMIGFTDRTNIFDSDNESHNSCIDFLIELIPEIQIQIFIGKYDDETETWNTTQDCSKKYGRGKHIIRILNKGNHFELITTPPKYFIRDSRTMTNRLATINQRVIMKLNNIKNI